MGNKPAVAASPFSHIRVALRGGGDLGSGVAYRLHRAGFPVLITELEHPLLVRRSVAFGSAVYEGSITVEGITARRVSNVQEALETQAGESIAVLIDPEGASLLSYEPTIIVDCRMRKTDPGPSPVTPSLTIGLGPGFRAPDNCDAVIETNRGHDLGRVIWQGAAQPNTGIPGRIADRSAERVLRAPANGEVTSVARIGQLVTEGQTVALVNERKVTAPFPGVLRGLVHDGLVVTPGAKIGDLDPRGNPSNCFTISEKARAIGGGVLEAILAHPAVRDLILQHP